MRGKQKKVYNFTNGRHLLRVTDGELFIEIV